MGQAPGSALPWLSLHLEADVQAASGPRAGSDLRALGQHSSRPRPTSFRYSPPTYDLGFR